MSFSGKQSPLGVNTLSSLLLNQGLSINSVTQDYTGRSKYNNDYTPGEVVNDTVLKKLTYTINNGYKHCQTGYTADLTDCTISGDRLTVGSLLNGTLQAGQQLVDVDSSTTIGTLLSQAPVYEGNGTEGSGSVWIISGAVAGTYQNVTATLPVAGSTTGYRLSNETYDRLVSIGASRIPALGNSPPPTYLINDPSDQWSGEATTGFPIEGDTGQGQNATWYPWTTSNNNSSITQWGWVRALALQAWQDFNWGNPVVNHVTPEYKWYTSFFNLIEGFRSQTNDGIMSMRNSLKYLEGSYSSMNDLITADITGVSLSTQAFGQDLINLGKAISLNKLDSFGLPSTLLYTLQVSGAVSDSLNILMLGADLTVEEINGILSAEAATFEQEQKLYNAMSQCTGSDLVQILDVIRCKTKGLMTLADLLDIKKMFPISFTTLTTPVYNTNDSPANSKIYYLLFVNRLLNPQLLALPIPPSVPARPPVIVPPPAVVEPIQEIVQPIETKPPTQQPPVEKFRGGGGGCVALESYIPLIETELQHNKRPVTNAWMLESGMKISLGKEDLQVVDGQVVKTLNDYQPCVRISTADGITLVCSTTAPILTKDKGFIPATEVYGKRVAVMRNGVTWYDEVVGLEDVGMKFVRVIDTGDNSFWAGERPGSFILHHNVIIDRNTYNYEKN